VQTGACAPHSFAQAIWLPEKFSQQQIGINATHQQGSRTAVVERRSIAILKL
jgi:hypothetical protein